MIKAKLIEFLAAGFMDANGNPLSGYQGRTFAADGTTPKEIWQDRDRTLPTAAGTAIFTLSATGSAVLFGSGIYTLKLWTPTTNPDNDTPYMTISGVEVDYSSGTLDDFLVAAAAAMDDIEGAITTGLSDIEAAAGDFAGHVAASSPHAGHALASDLSGHTGTLRAHIWPGAVVQEVIATRTTADVVTATTFTDTGLSAAITPLYNNSIIEAIAVIPRAHVYATGAGGVAHHQGQFRLRNSTNSVDGDRFRIGRLRTTTSDTGGQLYVPATVLMRYTVTSTAARTFVLQAEVYGSDMAISTGAETYAKCSLILREIKQ
jgi:hypothetical protein